MRIAVFGATGGTGREVVRQALGAGHEVLAVVRNPSRLPPSARLEILVGDVRDSSTYGDAVARCEAVVGALGTAGVPREPVDLYSGWARSVVRVCRERGPKRVVAVSAGAYVRSDRSPWMFRNVVQPLLLRTLRHAYDDMQRMEAVLAASALDWTVVQPGRLTDAPATGRVRTAVEDVVPGGWTVPRADVAGFVLRCVDEGLHIRQRVGITA